MPEVTAASAVFSRLVLYHNVLQSAPAQAMLRFLKATVSDLPSVEDRYLELVRTLFVEGNSSVMTGDAWQDHLLTRILADENPFTTAAVSGKLPTSLKEAARYDLRLLQRLFRLSATSCAQLVPDGLPHLPGWEETGEGLLAQRASNLAAGDLADAVDWGGCADRLASFHRQHGTGIFSSCWCFTWGADGLRGITNPHPAHLDELVCLDDAKGIVTRNTAQFLEGAPANNLLLYGSRGTGKSSMVRALPNRYGEAGLRLIEVSRNSLERLPELFAVLKRYRQRFVLFLDDLSFGEEQTDYKAFKSVMEGALEERPANVVLYATSNRRHLVPERWSDRNTPETAEVHGQDALEEKLSLADRFGVTVLFASPDQTEFLQIVESMARRRGLGVDPLELREAALRWVMWNNPRSGRSARQFIDDLAGRLSQQANAR